jgi:hypothetical protein
MYAKAVWKAAEAFVRDRPPFLDKSDVLPLLASFHDRIIATPLPGRSGSYRRKILLGLFSIAWKAGTIEPSFSQRQLAEASGVSRSAIGGHIRWALSNGWLTILTPAMGERAPVYRLNVEEESESPRSSFTSPKGGDVQTSGPLTLTSDHDAFRRGGLPPSCFEVLTHLDREVERTVPYLSAVTGRHPQTVRKGLKMMATVGMVATPDGRRWVRLIRDLEEVAIQLGTDGAGDRQRERHWAERVAFLQWRQEPREPKQPMGPPSRRRRSIGRPLGGSRPNGAASPKVDGPTLVGHMR